MSVKKTNLELCTHACTLLVQCEIRYPPGIFQETWKIPGALEKYSGPGFFQVLEISRTPGNFQGGYGKVSSLIQGPPLQNCQK